LVDVGAQGGDESSVGAVGVGPGGMAWPRYVPGATLSSARSATGRCGEQPREAYIRVFGCASEAVVKRGGQPVSAPPCGPAGCVKPSGESKAS